MKIGTLLVVTSAMASFLHTHAAQVGPAIICAGAARLDNGSTITIGQPFVGTMSTPDNSLAVNSGMVPVVEELLATNTIGPVIMGNFLINDSFTFGFSSTSGRNYVVLASTNLIDWTPIWVTNAVTSVVQFAEPGAATFHQRFYQVKIP